MKWLLIYRLSSGQWPDLKAVHSTYQRLTDGLHTWVEQSKDTYSWSTSSFPSMIYSGLNHLFYFFVIHILFLCPHIFIFIYTVHAGCLYVTDTLSTSTTVKPGNKDRWPTKTTLGQDNFFISHVEWPGNEDHLSTKTTLFWSQGGSLFPGFTVLRNHLRWSSRIF